VADGWKVIGMDTSLVLNPSMWLVFGMEWPADRRDDLFAEAAMAIAPAQIPLTLLSQAGRDVVQLSVAIGRRLGHRVVFFSDLTAALDERGQSWASLGIDWAGALQELQDAPVLGLFLSVSRRAHLIMCSSSRSRLVVHSPAGPPEEIDASERDAVRAAITDTLVADWRPYAESRLAAGAVREHQ
jgi:hypothetical protein